MHLLSYIYTVANKRLIKRNNDGDNTMYSRICDEYVITWFINTKED
jgi:hypothetical protein